MFPKVWRQPLVDNQEKRHTQEKTGFMNNNSRHAWFPQNGTLIPLRGEILGIWESISGILYLVFGVSCIWVQLYLDAIGFRQNVILVPLGGRGADKGQQQLTSLHAA